MKRIATLILTCLLLLCACGKADAPSAIKAEGGAYKADRTHYYAFFTDTEDTAYFLPGIFNRGDKLMYADKINGISSVLCGKPECEHNNADCNAALAGYPLGLTIKGNRVYWLEFGATEQAVKSCSLAGTNRSTIRAVDIELITKLNNQYALFWGHTAYLFGYGSTVADGEAKEVIRVYALDLNSDDVAIVLEEEADTVFTVFTTMQVYSENVYLLAGYRASDEEMYLRLYKWDAEDKVAEKIFDEEVGFIPYELRVDESGILVTSRDSEDAKYVYSVDLESGTVTPRFVFELAPNEEVTSAVFSGDYIVALGNAHGETEDFMTPKLWVMNNTGSTILAKELVEDFLLPLPDDNTYGRRFIGMDATSVYVEMSNATHTEDGARKWLEYLVAVPLDGGDTRLLWSSEE